MLAWFVAAGLLVAPPEIGCQVGGEGATKIRAHDLAIGPLVLVGGGRHGDRQPDAFGRHGYKIPMTLPAGMRATVEVPPAARGRVGLVFRPETQDAVWTRGVRAADTALAVTACPGEGRTGWPGGLVVDRPRCATLVVRVQGRAAVRRRVPLGRTC